MTRKKIIVVTAVWGDWHINCLVNANLPTLLAPNNLPYLARHHDVEYSIFTRESDREKIESSKAFQALARAVGAKLFTDLPSTTLASLFEVHHEIWMRAYKRAVTERCFVLNMPPDVAFADGAGRTMVELMAKGKRSITWMYNRAIAETIMPVMQSRYSSAEGIMAIPPREFVALNLRHLHSLTMSSFAESPYFVKHPEMILWPVKGEGLLMRTLINVNALYEPAHFKLTQNYLLDEPLKLDEVAQVEDSDDLFAISLAPFAKDFDWHLYPRKADPVRIARWWLFYDSPANDFLLNHKLRYHTGERTPALWRQREHRANLFLSRCVAAREGLRIWRAAWDCGHTWLAGLLAAAIETKAILRAFPRPFDAVVFGPSNRAAEHSPGTSVEALLAPGNGAALLRFLRSHVALDEQTGTPLVERLRQAGTLRLRTLACEEIVLTQKGRGRIAVNGAIATGPALKAGRHTFIPVDTVLGAGAETAARTALAAPSV